MTRSLALLAVAGAALAFAASAPAATVSFRTPSKLVYCAYTTGPTFLRCDTRYRTRFSGTKECREGDFGQGFGMTRTGRGRALCISDSVFDERARVLRYGTSRRFGPFKCTSRTTGLTCRNARGHGWTLSRQRQRVF